MAWWWASFAPVVNLFYISECRLNVSDGRPGVREVTTEVFLVTGTPAQLVAAKRTRLAEAPDDDLRRFFLAMSLFESGEYAEAAELAMQLLPQEGAGKPSVDLATRQGALPLVVAAMKEVRGLLWNTVAEYGGPDGAQMTLEHWNRALLELEGEAALVEGGASVADIGEQSGTDRAV
jgi:hypothetical protein